ncbi:carbonic anhydrase [Gynuella sunshinyii]|uniref:Carbonic anhydrase n=1 Tax=Gynuella sunshinyii YC6258 TaxID=1445510 RepID=A0A0C5VPY8_9GAMM|nr:carbonic anhydrase family protein [Gynuella sunshinyii]AJQ96286.1 carbonic anhydrase [Gynuella sunshinyii YC6258]
MKKSIAGMFAGIAFGVASMGVLASDWSYEGVEGPEYWGNLSPDFVMCKSGKNQSPINITNLVKGKLPRLDVNYSAAGKEIINNGHTVQVNYQPGSTLTVDGHSYELKQFHFHTPSENHINGQPYDLEAHFVHADKDGNLAVMAVMFKVGKENQALNAVWKDMPEHKGDKVEEMHAIDGASLLPKKLAYYRYNGSLTTPPCSEGVVWLVLKDVQEVSADQVAKFAGVLEHPNNRPIQKTNARVVIR